EAGNDELAELARRLQTERPELSPEALERVRQSVQAAASAPPRSRWRFPLGVGAAAALLVAVGALTFVFLRPQGPPAVTPQGAAPERIEDRYKVPLAGAHAAAAPARPLLPVADYQSLYAD